MDLSSKGTPGKALPKAVLSAKDGTPLSPAKNSRWLSLALVYAVPLYTNSRPIKQPTSPNRSEVSIDKAVITLIAPSLPITGMNFPSLNLATGSCDATTGKGLVQLNILALFSHRSLGS